MTETGTCGKETDMEKHTAESAVSAAKVAKIRALRGVSQYKIYSLAGDIQVKCTRRGWA